MTDDVLARDYFANDLDLMRDPYPWLEAARAHGPIWQEPNQGVFIVTGHEEYIQIADDTGSFSSLVASLGPFTGELGIDTIPLPDSAGRRPR